MCNILVRSFFFFIRRFLFFVQPNLEHQDLSTLFHYWMEFCPIINTSNALFSHLLCLLLGVQGVLFVLNSYSVLSRLLLTTTGQYCQCTPLSAIIMIFTLWNIYSICDISHHVTKQVSAYSFFFFFSYKKSIHSILIRDDWKSSAVDRLKHLFLKGENGS